MKSWCICFFRRRIRSSSATMPVRLPCRDGWCWLLLAVVVSVGPSSLRCNGYITVHHQQRPRSDEASRRMMQQQRQPLIPEENPDFDSGATSVAGVSYGAVRQAMHRMFPPSELEKRNAQSRTDGYWPYIQRGDDPPADLTYGEFDLYFFSQLLDRAATIRQAQEQDGIGDSSSSTGGGWEDKVFVDIGSGTGRLVLSAAALHPRLRLCRGVELLPTIHDQAVQNLQSCRLPDDEGYALPVSSSDPSAAPLRMAPVQLVCGSLDDPYVYFGDADLIFVFSSCMTPPLLQRLACAVGRQCRPGTLVITTEYMLPLEGYVPPVERDERLPSGSYQLGLVEKVNGWCWLTGGSSTAFIHRVESSLWAPGMGPLERPQPSPQDTAFDVAMALESGTLTDTKRFLRGVRNNMIFHGFPTSFLPNLDDD